MSYRFIIVDKGLTVAASETFDALTLAKSEAKKAIIKHGAVGASAEVCEGEGFTTKTLTRFTLMAGNRVKVSKGLGSLPAQAEAQKDMSTRRSGTSML
jgi:hypothetical protein